MATRFVAEVSSNHNRELERGLEFISTAARIGCDGVKFQLFRLEELFAPEAIRSYPHIRARVDWELPVEFLPDLAGRARECEIDFSCTPFYLEAVEQLRELVDFYKIASYELLWHDLLRACAATGKPVVLSTGMATMDEIDRAVAVLSSAGCRDLTLLHCVSGYPAPPEQCNLKVIATLRSRFPHCRVGWSDHSVSEAVLCRAVNRFGAEMVEFHLDLDRRGEEFGSGHCWLPDAMGRVIDVTRQAEACDGSGEKRPVESELADREWRADPEDGLRPLRHVRQGLAEPKGRPA